MGMSEFDRQFNSEGDEIFSTTAQGQVIPADFGEEDLVFAEELNTLFSLQEEALPPYYVQTLLASEDPRFNPVEPGFEHKTSVRVFRRLKLRRRLFYAPRSILGAFITGISGIYARRSLLVSAAVFMLIVLFTVAFTAPSFAEGMAILLHGARGGVYEINHYPKVVHRFSSHHKSSLNEGRRQSNQISLLAAQKQLQFNIYWPQTMPGNYSLASIYLYQVADQPWADGPVVELTYDLSGVKPKGTGQIVIREILPDEDVLQVVQDNAVHLIQVGQDGQPKAIYVDGQWVPNGRLLPQWAYGGRSELIYQQNGVIFWIAGDQRDGIGEKILWNIAQSLQTMQLPRLKLMQGEMSSVTQASLGDVSDPFTTDIIIPGGSTNGAYFINESTYQSEKPVQQVVNHGH
jgi:hypothetical protein